MILLTKEQQNRLKAVSSNVFGDKRENLTDEQVEATAAKINEVLYELHQESPQAFVTVPHKDAKGKYYFTKMFSW
jgi:hypothetical protein